MKRTALASIVLLVVCGGVRAQSLSVEKIRNPAVAYAPAAELKTYPVPAIAFQSGGLGSDQERAELLERIVYPIINKSPQPIAAVVVVELVPINPHPKTKADLGFSQIMVMVLWHNGGYAGALIEKNKDGHFDENAYAILLGTEDECCDEEECEIEIPARTP